MPERIVWAMRVRAIHNAHHTAPMATCQEACQEADRIITADHNAK